MNDSARYIRPCRKNSDIVLTIAASAIKYYAKGCRKLFRNLRFDIIEDLYDLN